jgi:hypothetical protein
MFSNKGNGMYWNFCQLSHRFNPLYFNLSPGDRSTAEDIREFTSDIQILMSALKSFFICGIKMLDNLLGVVLEQIQLEMPSLSAVMIL